MLPVCRTVAKLLCETNISCSALRWAQAQSSSTRWSGKACCGGITYRLSFNEPIRPTRWATRNNYPLLIRFIQLSRSKVLFGQLKPLVYPNMTHVPCVATGSRSSGHLTGTDKVIVGKQVLDLDLHIFSFIHDARRIKHPSFGRVLHYLLAPTNSGSRYGIGNLHHQDFWL